MNAPKIAFSAGLLVTLLTALLVSGAGQASGPADTAKLFIIGQDLDTVKAYYDSGCCPAPDGNTFYLAFYDLLDASKNFGGIGIDKEGNPVPDVNKGNGTENGWSFAQSFPGGVAIGLEMVENTHPGALDRFVAGDYDAEIRQLAKFAKRLDKPVWLRIGYEFDGTWNQGYQDRERYKQMFRRMVDGIRAEGADNVQFVWQSSTSPIDDIIEQVREDIREWYPGDEYVDWMGTSWFLGIDELPLAESTYRVPTQRQLMDEMTKFARERGKPVMIAEAAPQGYDLARLSQANIAPVWDGNQHQDLVPASPEEIWQQWYQPVFDYMEANGDVIRALAYINTNWDAQPRWGDPWAEGYWGDSRLQANEYIARQFSLAIDKWRSD